VNEFVALGLIVVLVLQFSMMKWEMLALQRRGRPMWLALIPVVSLLVIAFDAVAGWAGRRTR
jgi:hypothetical protein